MLAAPDSMRGEILERAGTLFPRQHQQAATAARP